MQGIKTLDYMFYGDQLRWFVGTVVGNPAADPAQLGRVQVRIVGIHDGSDIRIGDLPWASVMLPSTESGVIYGQTSTRLQPGAQVFGVFVDGEHSQQPLVLGSIPYNASPTAQQAASQRFRDSIEQQTPVDLDAPAPYPNPPEGVGYTWLPGVDPRVDPALLEILERIAKRFGRGLKLNSGYRSPARNARVGGAKNSWHMRGKAVDMWTARDGLSRNEVRRLVAIASSEGINGIGIYSGSVHFDIRPNKAAWGPSFRSDSIPVWIDDVIDNHIAGNY